MINGLSDVCIDTFVMWGHCVRQLWPKPVFTARQCPRGRYSTAQTDPDGVRTVLQVFVDRHYVSPGQVNVDLFRSGSRCSYGPLGTELRLNLLNQWWHSVTRSTEQVFGIDTLSSGRKQEADGRRIVESGLLQQIFEQRGPSKEQVIQEASGLLQSSPSVRTSLLQGALELYVPSLELVNRRLPFGLAEMGLCFQPSDFSDLVLLPSHVFTVAGSLDETKVKMVEKNFSSSEVPEDDLERVASRGVRIMYSFPWGQECLETLWSRGNEELLLTHNNAHSKLQCRDGQKSVPHVVSISGNMDRGMMAFLFNSLQQLKKDGSKQKLQHRKVLKLHPVLAPVKVALDIGRGPTVELRQLCEGLLQEFREAKIFVWPGYLGTLPTSVELLNTRYDEMGVLFTVVIILQIIKESQQQHGLRHGDYQRYRGYCSRRLRRLRKTLGFKMGNRHKFVGKKITVEMLSDSRYLLLVLMEAERAWSYAMQLKQEANTEPRKRFHLLSRLRKAAKHSEKLEKLCESPRVDAKTKLEAQAYTAYLTGMVEFELQATIYEKLASAFTEELALLYRQRVDEISPNIRYCAYNIGDQNAINDLMQMRLTGGGGGMMAEKLEALITQARTKQAATMSEVEWRGRTVPVKIDKARIFLLGLADNEAAIAQTVNEDTKEHLYETLLAECRDTIQAVKEELKNEAKQRERSSDNDGGKVSNLQFLHSYLTYIKLCTLVKRNESMAHTLQAKLKETEADENKRGPRPQDLIRLYDIILQSLAELSTLQGLEDDHMFQKELSLKLLVYKAYRCFFIAQSYVLVKKWSEALVLYERVLKYAKEVQSKSKSLNKSLKDLPDVQELIAEVNAEKYSLQAAAILDTDDTAEVSPHQQVKESKPLCERLDTFRLDATLVGKQPNLVQFPPEFQPIPCKPLFFDLALNHVAFPPLDDKVEQKGKGGLTGYIKGIFGFGS
ncbi:unnamed protein product [Menidia menidia]|uniref:Signal recognition particle subunit SRP68 n=1 Tax=Menidia menidia TaxID=238744 RepID=A0A8S4BD37_9TELE|nr:unnamed protein product [Menidia menidia]